MEIAALDWDDPGETVVRYRDAPPDLVLAADVVYHEKAIAPLARLLPELLGAGAGLVLAHKRRNDRIEDALICALLAAGLHLEEVDGGENWGSNVVVFIGKTQPTDRAVELLRAVAKHASETAHRQMPGPALS